MNAMVQDMSWDLAARQEGCEITALSSEEMEEVNGAGWFTAAVGAVGGWAGSHGHATHRRVIIAAAAAILAC